MVHARVVSEPIDPSAVLARVGAPEDGALLLFTGVVRNHAEGRAVGGIHYDAYVEMAEEVLAEIAREAAEIVASDHVAVEHRVGSLEVGEPSVAIAVSSPHRAEAYEASRYVIEEIKKRLPVWKKERFSDGDEAWVEGAVPPSGAAAPASGATGSRP